MHYFYFMLLVLSTTDAFLNFKKTVLSILDPSKNTTEKIKILQDLSKYLQDQKQINAKDNTLKKINIISNETFSKSIGNPERSPETGRSFLYTIPVSNKYNQRRIWEESSSSSYVKLQFSTKREVRKFVPVSITDIQGDDATFAVPKPWGFKCQGPKHQDMHWGTCILPEKCNEENRIHLGDNFCDKTAYICCSHSGTAKYPSLVHAEKPENNRFTDAEDENEADARDRSKAAFIRKKLRRAKQINYMLSPSLMKQGMGRGLQTEPKDGK